MNTAVATIPSRLPMPQGVSELDSGKWRVLCESVFPTARTTEAIMLAMDYCRARKLDIMKKPVNIVPMWSSSLGREVETVWPSITEVQTTASRTGKYAGMDEPKWGPDVTRTFKGVRKGNVGETEVTLTFPESCAVTVYRIVDGQRCSFTEPVYWEECYARIGKTELPNDMWIKRKRGQFIKVAKAFSLRAAFPEEGEHTAEEMEGRILEEVDAGGMVIDAQKPLKVGSPFKNHSLRNSFVANVESSFEKAVSTEELTEIMSLNKAKFDEMAASNSDHDTLALNQMRHWYKMYWNRLVSGTPVPNGVTIDELNEAGENIDGEEIPPFIREMDAQYKASLA